MREPPPATWPPNLRLVYIIDLTARSHSDGLSVELATEPVGAEYPPGELAPFELAAGVWLAAPDAADREIARLLLGPHPDDYRSGRIPLPASFLLRDRDFDTTLAAISATGRSRIRLSATELSQCSVHWDAGEPWRLELTVHEAESGPSTLTGALRRAGGTMPLSAPQVLHQAGVLYVGDTLARVDHGGAFIIAATLRTVPRIPLAEGELPDLLETLYALPNGPAISLPGHISIGEQTTPPRPWLSITADPSPWKYAPPVLTLGFEYGDARIPVEYSRDTVFDKTKLTLYRRDRDAERQAREKLVEAGVREEPDFTPRPPRLTIAKRKLGPLVLQLIRDGWRVEASGVRYRTPGVTRAAVRSGIDWFDLDLVVEYDGVAAPLPALLDALRKRQTTVTLADGSVGLLPLDLLSRFGPALAAGSPLADVTRFTRSQVGLLDALLATMPDVSVDETFETARARLHDFEGITPADAAPTFVGTLREYQREGLGWLRFLRDFELGGCLADDMGLGKTVQVLALLDLLPRERPSIIVVPRSLVFNWMREASRFAPSLRVLDYSGQRRRLSLIDAGSIDVVLTTYGTLRQDIAELSTIDFEYAILDEAQAIKNANTGSAKAARLLRARHRLALSGTPIENRLQELWSLFEFLNPGMLGAASTFGLMADLATDAPADDGVAGREILRRALRPVILRRTKDQVAPELPDRVEQTLYVDLETHQRKFYMDLLERTRRTVFDEVDRVGIGGARMHILEALLRLRQAACAPVLADPTKVHLPSAKLDALVPALAEIVSEGHKAVVFSQFTSFLALVRRRLEAASIEYEYLDGSTRDREQRVDHFQSASGPPVFLVSLKAGGHGLNLTAADYVYLLDPWWNPAVEAQAIDRAHRIGQTRRVIATRLVARATIEEKVLELQASKRALADAILGADQGVLAKIGREELEMLLTAG
ncbi:MAG: SNF2-related protein [Gemmatimonadetes bacterium]|nr:SNF2-related protein [Gemmatimonadota bacterium]